jgi:hypothetical protein
LWRQAGTVKYPEAHEQFDTRYRVNYSVYIALSGLPVHHTRKEIHQVALDRLQAGDHHDIDSVVIEQIEETDTQ